MWSNMRGKSKCRSERRKTVEGRGLSLGIISKGRGGESRVTARARWGTRREMVKRCSWARRWRRRRGAASRTLDRTPAHQRSTELWSLAIIDCIQVLAHFTSNLYANSSVNRQPPSPQPPQPKSHLDILQTLPRSPRHDAQLARVHQQRVARRLAPARHHQHPGRGRFELFIATLEGRLHNCKPWAQCQSQLSSDSPLGWLSSLEMWWWWWCLSYMMMLMVTSILKVIRDMMLPPHPSLWQE